MIENSRINVVGTSGVGKSTFSKKLSQKINSPYVEMDKIFWGPNWHWPSDQEFFQNLRQAIETDRWVLDGNYTRTVPIKWERVNLVVWLDYSFLTTLYQAIKRALKRSLTQEELWEGTGNKESFKKSFFSKDSIILWTIKTHKQVRTKYELYMSDPKYAHIQFVRLRNHSEAENFLKNVTEAEVLAKYQPPSNLESE